MSKFVNRALIVTCFAALISIPLAATTVKSAANKGSASATDPNIKSNSLANTPGKTVVAPHSKGGPAAKGPGCVLHIDNSTGYIVEFYFNGVAQGAMSPWGDYQTAITPGGAQLYGTATFTNGQVLTFGPQAYICTASPGADAVFTWTLTP
jgi:hypothetical protein